VTESLSVDVCVIGAGSGGLTVAAFCAMLGAPAVLIEKGEMGGDCLNVGCVPSKALIAAARRAEDIRSAGAFGIGPTVPEIDFAAVQAHVREAIAAIAPTDSVARFTALGVRVIRGAARFTGPKTVEVGGTVITARRFVIATGARPAVPDIPGLDAVPFYTNETIFSLAECPDHLAVLGGGAVGLELAQAFRRLGAEVTLFERDRILAREDAEMTDVIRRRLVADGITIHEGSEVSRVERDGADIRVHAIRAGEEGAIGVSHVLVALGRKPNTDDLGLESAGIAFNPHGVSVDKALRTTNKRVYAIGDVTGQAGFTHVAGWHGSLVAQNILFRRPIRTDRTAVPRVTYTDPELAHIGLTEAEARASDRKARVLRWPFAENDRAVATRRREGHVKLVVGHKGAILGCSIAGPEAGDLIAPYAVALAKGMTVQDLSGIILPYPTLSEAGKRAAGTYFVASLSNPWIGRVVRFLRRFG
jgi:pyruvate/2-oxoglutarate dehydrogenase complex dihydrolipoamide dehydrogenase (E3) component